MKKELRIVYMGTPDFAVPPLKSLVENGYNVVGVITVPDKPKGRGQKVSTSAVKDYAVSQGLNILQPANLKAPEFLEELKSLEANLQVVVAFRMLPESVWSMPEYGTFNLHGSLLPQYRGAAPIHWAVINGEEKTGLTTFFLKHEIDTGSIIFREEEPIKEEDTVGDVYGRLMAKGGDLVLKTVKAIEEGDYTLTPQDESQELKHAPKIFKETCEVDWNQPTSVIYNFIRGLSPFPVAWTILEGQSFKIFNSSKELADDDRKPGEIWTDNKSFLKVKTLDGYISLNDLQMQGKKRMKVTDLLNGKKFNQ
ncbi:methionyl-tRNA formyltransferase [Aureibacter tunicatorum]|uniref:Methionyl-tRNA formyltransferase n=1 Tax=Aureibacter tunicatorum TaxID=866807 RepID=A0AAE4BTP6_9BACT|nr:methionyl-tRNA formyltransferase [Aureibacter tunicatorum]MDR6240911.1 methionyl-tRNA formyltransferase [Aureibacter tunicatorum]BDD03691.1 methionyl-tRNA formyltransferase [Aureibacter tunicatorum]